MTRGLLSRRVVVDRLAWIDTMLADIRALPLADAATFAADRRNAAAAESGIRRAIEALFDLGRHILAKGFGEGATEYKAAARQLSAHGVLAPAAAERLVRLAGYRNRMVHFYHEVTADELYDICAHHLDDLTLVADAFRAWIAANGERLTDDL